MNQDDIQTLAENHAGRAYEMIGPDPEEAPAGFTASSMPQSVCDYVRNSPDSLYALERELGYSREALKYHRDDRCVHEQSSVDERRCAVMREMADERELVTIAAFFSVSPDTVSYHVRGKCSCSHTVSVVLRHEVDTRTCQKIRTYQQRGYSCSKIGDIVGFSKGTIARHGRGDCQHG